MFIFIDNKVILTKTVVKNSSEWGVGVAGVGSFNVFLLFLLNADRRGVPIIVLYCIFFLNCKLNVNTNTTSLA
jgi:hypothetical protein